VEIATQQCEHLPQGMSRQVNELIGAVCQGRRVVEKTDALVDGLDGLLSREGFELSHTIGGEKVVL
jgi:hypothetical protein